MHQTFYVDVDEEVSSIIVRLRKSTSKYNILVVAQQALILQSSVSLKLVKKEMDELKKKVMIVTQDERGLAMARKVGFPVKKTIDEVNKGRESGNNSQAMPVPQESKATNLKQEANKNELSVDERNRLNNLGDNDYIAVNDISIESSVRKEENENKYDKKLDFNLDKSKENEFSDLFAEKIDEPDASPSGSKSVAKGAGKFLWLFSIVSVALILGIFAYLFFPKAEINVTPKQIQKDINLILKAQGDTQDKESSSDVINLKSVSVEANDTLSLSFDATGQKASASKKARGIITIYNSFSETSQILVATTRFLSEDGKLFRLTKSVTVPGMKVENGNQIPGEIEAEVIADQPGDEYNIDSTTFKIPGFEGGVKYDKFSAKSGEKMKGGGEGESDLKVVSQTDIDKAKKETLEKIKSQLAQKIKEKVGDENVFSENDIEYEVLDSASFPEIEAIADNFEYQIKVKARYLTFSATDLDEKINKYMDAVVLQQDFPVKVVSMEKTYGKSKTNFSNNSTEVKLTVSILLEASVDSEEIKQELLGKDQAGVDEFIRQHSELQKIDATILPSFLASRIPKYSSRVKVNINSQQ